MFTQAKRRSGIVPMDISESKSNKALKNVSFLKNLVDNANSGKDHLEEDSDQEGGQDEAADLYEKNLGQNSRRAYLRELRKVVERADVILQVLDARDPMGTKSKSVEDMVLANSKKKLVYVLNKADLVPREALLGWLTYLRQTNATVPFKCNTQAQKGNLSVNMYVLILLRFCLHECMYSMWLFKTYV